MAQRGKKQMSCLNIGTSKWKVTFWTIPFVSYARRASTSVETRPGTSFARSPPTFTKAYCFTNRWSGLCSQLLTMRYHSVKVATYKNIPCRRNTTYDHRVFLSHSTQNQLMQYQQHPTYRKKRNKENEIEINKFAFSHLNPELMLLNLS